MNNIKKWKKIFFAIVAMIVALRIGYICMGGEVDKKYYTSAVLDITTAREVPCHNVSEKFKSNQKRLNSIELIFNNIADEKTGYITLCILNGEEKIYQTNISLTNIENLEWKKVFINAELSDKKEYIITLNASDDCVQVPNVLIIDGVENVAPEAMGSFMDGDSMDGEIAINYGYLQFPGFADRFVTSSLWILFLVLFFVILYYYESIINKVKTVLKQSFTEIRIEVFLIIIQILACMIIVNCSGIEFQESTKILLYAISLFSIMGFDKKRCLTNGLAVNGFQKFFLLFLYCYAAFALVGQRIFIYPLTVKLTTAGLFVYVVTIFWFVPVIQTILYFFEKASEKCFSGRKSMKTSAWALLSILLLILPAAYNLFANNPGISSVDTGTCMIQNAHHLQGMTDWHPAFYCMILSVILSVWDSTYAVIIVQYIFWCYVMMELLIYLRKKGMRDPMLMAIASFLGLNAGNFIHINTIWKDIPYTLSLVWVFIILAKLSIDYEENKKRWYIYLELIIALVGVCLYRKNGIVSFAITVIMLIVFMHRNIKVWCSLALTILLIVTIKGPLYNYYEVVDTEGFGMYIGLGQDVLGVYYAGGEVSKETLQMINTMTFDNNAEYQYTPTWSNQSYDLDVKPTEFVINYLDTFFKNPITMLRAVIDRQDAMWDIFLGEDSVLGCVNSHGTMDGREEELYGFDWNAYYPARKYVSLYTSMSAATEYTARSQWISAIEWRSGLAVLTGLIAILYLCLKKEPKKYLLMLSPLAGHILSLLLSTGWADFRYYWPINLMNMALILMAIVIVHQDKNGKLEINVK